jgi:predicted ATPase
MATAQEIIAKLLTAKQCEPFIRHIRFPVYKNLAPNTRIDFLHPITVLVGTNGTNKSSVMRALYGTPGYVNLGNLWFSSKIDPIEEGEGAPNCFIYAYENPEAQKVVEILKTRVKREDDPDNWEPSRPLTSYGMEAPVLIDDQPPPGASKTRWIPMKKEVVYLDFRAALSAYDKFFYHGEIRQKAATFKNKKDFIRQRSPYLKKAVDLGLPSLNWHGERVIGGENRQLRADEVKAISQILGREYSEIRLIRHRFYNSDGYTAQMKSKALRYTEAFAGSGEFSVVRLVTSVMNTPEKSLILLDEPEVSLHPGAQERLMDFLADQVKQHKHQVVISTHSPALVRNLPPNAIKVMVMDPHTGKITIPRQESLPDEAFFHIGEPVRGRKTVIVEDKLGKEIVHKALRTAGEAIFKLFDVLYFPGGAETIWGHYMPAFSAEKRDDVIVLFDGDNKPKQDIPDPDTIPPAHENDIAEIIKAFTGVDIEFPVDGNKDKGGDVDQRQTLRRQYIEWTRAYVDFLPYDTPEEYIWMRCPETKDTPLKEGETYKTKIRDLAKTELGRAEFEDVKAEDIFQTQKRLLAKVPDDDDDIVNLREALIAFQQK